MISLKGLIRLISHSYQLIGDDLRSRRWEGVDDVSFFFGGLTPSVFQSCLN